MFADVRDTLGRKAGSGRPSTSTEDQNVEIVRELIEGNNQLSCPHISTLTGIEQTAVYRILTNKLHKKSLCCKWVPYVLSD